MCLLDLVYRESSGKEAGEVVWLPGALKAELTSLRAQYVDRVDLVDASPWCIAGVAALLDARIVRELAGHCLTRGRWVALLSQRRSLLRAKGLLVPELELPDGEESDACADWTYDVLTRLKYHVTFKAAARGKEHINLGETREFIAAERKAAIERPSTRVFLGADSQVQLGATIKGRASAPRANYHLQRGLPSALGETSTCVSSTVLRSLMPAMILLEIGFLEIP